MRTTVRRLIVWAGHSSSSRGQPASQPVGNPPAWNTNAPRFEFRTFRTAIDVEASEKENSSLKRVSVALKKVSPSPCDRANSLVVSVVQWFVLFLCFYPILNVWKKKNMTLVLLLRFCFGKCFNFFGWLEAFENNYYGKLNSLCGKFSYEFITYLGTLLITSSTYLSYLHN